ncbi:MAG: DUF1177 domain-containing protein [Bacillota bacterium]
MWKQCIELYEALDSAYINGESVRSLLAAHGAEDVECETVAEGGMRTDFISVLIKGTAGRSAGGPAPTLGIVGRLGGLGARPEITGFVSDGDGALCALSAALKLLDMARSGDRLKGDVTVCTHICPNAPTVDHSPVRLMGSPIRDAVLNALETRRTADAILSIDTTKGNRILCKRGFAITPTVKEGYILRVSDSLLDIMSRVTGSLPAVLPITMQDITPYGNGIYHLNSILQPSVTTCAPVVGVAITTEVPVAGCATGATHLSDVEAAARFAVETAKDFTAGVCSFYDAAEFARLKELYGDMRRLQRTQ